jgi:sulfur-oxidizing protein SoxA
VNWRLALVALTAAGLIPCAADALEPPIAPSALRSGIQFAGAEARAMQADDFANPGMLWVTRGERMWREPAGSAGKSCASCHGAAEESMKGVATRYPRVDPAAARLVNVSGRINICRERNQGAPPFAQESAELLALDAYVSHQSRGLPKNVSIDGASAPFFERGRALYYRRLGQMNISCGQCHDRNWGRALLNETISQGHGTGFPAYKTSWQTLGSLQRRIRACYSGVRAEMPGYGAADLLDLELFLAWRANGLAIETPAVRR